LVCSAAAVLHYVNHISIKRENKNTKEEMGAGGVVAIIFSPGDHLAEMQT
jgi:hypothetical protein